MSITAGFALKIAFRYLHRYEKAVDAVNEAFVKLLNNIHRFEMGDSDVCIGCHHPESLV